MHWQRGGTWPAHGGLATVKMLTGIDEPMPITSAGPVFSYERKLAAAKTLRARNLNRIDDRVPPDT
eukprot:3295070-Pyramimonas_sp.AAC.1